MEWATSKNDPESLGLDKCNIFVGGLNPLLVTEEGLRERFCSFGELESVTLVNRHSEESEDDKGPSHPRSAFAFLRFKDVDASASAIDQDNGSEWLDRKIRVQYCESQEMKNKRRAAKGGFQYSSFSAGMPGMNMNMFYPGAAPPQNGMMMMGAWYPPVYPGMDSYPPPSPYGYPPTYSGSHWGFNPSFNQPMYPEGGEFMPYHHNSVPSEFAMHSGYPHTEPSW